MGNAGGMERTIRVADVRTFQTKSGNTRYLLRDENGNEYTTFREEIGRSAQAAKGRQARIEYHEQQRDGFQNVYLDAVELLPEQAGDGDDESVDEVAWKTAVESAPWLVGSKPPERGVPAEKLFEKLQPFKELVAEDIRDGEHED
jgi:hypothetical protein